jgi:hypothetical protein
MFGNNIETSDFWGDSAALNEEPLIRSASAFQRFNVSIF